METNDNFPEVRLAEVKLSTACVWCLFVRVSFQEIKTKTNFTESMARFWKRAGEGGAFCPLSKACNTTTLILFV